MPTTTLKPKTTKGGSATKASLTNASAEKSRKMLEQMLAKKLSSSTKIPKTMTIKTGATKKSTATRSASAGASKGRKGGRRGGGEETEAADAGQGQGENEGHRDTTADEREAELEALKRKALGGPDAQETLTEKPAAENATPAKPGPYTFKCTAVADTAAAGGYTKRSYTKKSSCSMSSKRPMSSTPTKKSSCGASTMSSKRPMFAATKPKPKSTKK